MVSDDMELKSADDGSSAGESASPQAPAGAAATQTANEGTEDKDKGSRVDAAKAFFRAMYAGDENAEPTDTGAYGGGARSGGGEVGSCRNCTGMEFALKEAEAKASEADTLYRRMAADFDNFRRRMEKQSEESAAAGVRKAVEALLPALDDFDRAKTFLNADTPPDKLFEGFNLVFTRLLGCLEATGVKRIQSVGEPFDPKFHEPVQQITTTEIPDGHVAQELRGGYMMHDKVIRPAMVNVADNPNGAAVTAPAAAGAAAATPPEASPPEAAPAAPAAEAPTAAPAEEAPKE